MKKITIKWILISLGVGLVPILILGASRGGIGLSPYILVLSLIIGLLGASTHVCIYAFRKGSKKQKYSSAGFSLVSLLIVGWLVLESSGCNVTEEYANNRVLNHIESKDNLFAKYLGSPEFSEKECTFTYSYQSPGQNFQFLVSPHGGLHFIGE